MSDDIFDTLCSELTADIDDSGIPESALFWDEVFTRIVEAYEDGTVPDTAHLEMQSEGEATTGGVLYVSSSVRPLIAVSQDNAAGTLIGSSTTRNLTVTPVTLQVLSDDYTLAIPAWIAVTRGGQRWALLIFEDSRQMVNLKDLEFSEGLDDNVGDLEFAGGPYEIVRELEFASRVQQRHMGLDLPGPEYSPLDLITSIAVSQAAQVSGRVPIGPDLFAASAQRALQAQIAMRVASLRALLNVTRIFEDDRLPIDALIRLDALSENLEHPGCGRPDYSSRILSPGATATLRLAFAELANISWDGITAERLRHLTEMSEEEARWWGPRGIALVCLRSTGGIGGSWDELTAQVGPFVSSLVSDAARTGLSGPSTS